MTRRRREHDARLGDAPRSPHNNAALDRQSDFTSSPGTVIMNSWGIARPPKRRARLAL
jgi:hypothetical protein